MHLIDVTNSYRRMVENQLSGTDAQYIKVYSLGSNTVIYSESRRQINVVISNKVRKIKDIEQDFVIDNFFKDYDKEDLQVDVTDKRRVIDISTANKQSQHHK